VAYAGEDGEVAIFKERMLQDNRMRRAHTTVAGLSDLSDAERSSSAIVQHEPLHELDRHAVCPAATQLLAVCTLLKQFGRFLLHTRAFKLRWNMPLCVSDALLQAVFCNVVHYQLHFGCRLH